LTCLCCSLLGYHLIFNFQLAAVKSEMKAVLKHQRFHKDVVQLSLIKKEAVQLEWENENELRYNGEMYDVIDRKNLEDRIIIRCIPDEAETALLNEYQKHNRHNSSNSIIAQFITTLFILPLVHSLEQPQKLLKKSFFDRSASLQNPASDSWLPPPDC
jgi:hypothetical protein